MHYTCIYYVIGTDLKRIVSTVNMLNLEFRQLIDQDIALDEAYRQLVVKHPPRLLSSHEYSHAEPALRSSRRNDGPSESDVIIELREISIIIIIERLIIINYF